MPPLSTSPSVHGLPWRRIKRIPVQLRRLIVGSADADIGSGRSGLDGAGEAGIA